MYSINTFTDWASKVGDPSMATEMKWFPRTSSGGPTHTPRPNRTWGYWLEVSWRRMPGKTRAKVSWCTVGKTEYITCSPSHGSLFAKWLAKTLNIIAACCGPVRHSVWSPSFPINAWNVEYGVRPCSETYNVNTIIDFDICIHHEITNDSHHPVWISTSLVPCDTSRKKTSK